MRASYRSFTGAALKPLPSRARKQGARKQAARYANLVLAFPLLLAAAVGTFDQALNLYYQTDYAKAIAVLNQLPSSPRVQALLGECYFLEGDYQKATFALEAAAAAEPNNSMVQTWLGRTYGRRAESGFALAAPALAAKARDAFEKAARLDPTNGEGINDLFEYYLNAPQLLGGGIEKARALIPQISKNDPAEGHFASARMDEQQKKFSSAEEHLRQAIAAAPQQPGRVIDLAQYLARRGRFEESDQVFAQAAKLEPDAPRLMFARAEAWIKSKRNLPQARALLERYLQAHLTPEDPTRAEARKLLKKLDGK